MSHYSYLSKPDPEWLQLADKLPAKDKNLTVQERRQLLSESAQRWNELWDYPKSGLKVSNTTVPVQDGSIQIRTYVPEDNSVTFPILVFFHGGGFTVGDLEFDDALLRLVCVKQRISCVNVDYRMIPEHPFPTPVEDCYHATQWAANNASSLSADPRKGFIVGGASAGANLAAVVALKARDDPAFPTKLTGQILQVPSVCPPQVYPEKWKDQLLSMDELKDAPMLNKQETIDTFAAYGPSDLTLPDVAPLLASTHRNLPATFFQICGLDPLRDEAFLYEKVLSTNEVPTKFSVYPGQPHSFHISFPQMTQSKKWREDFVNGVEWLLRL